MPHLPLFLAFLAGTSLSIAYAATAAFAEPAAVQPMTVECACRCETPPAPAPEPVVEVEQAPRAASDPPASEQVPRVRQATASVEGHLDKDVIRRIVRAHINEVRGCYNQGLSLNPDLGGRVTVNFVIDASGRVTRSTVQENSVESEEVAPCIAEVVKGWKFPEPRGGGEVIVTYPFNLTPG